MKKYTIDRLEKSKGVSFSDTPYKVDTAGFEPLDCKIKRFMLSGEIAQFSKSMFDSNDYKEMMSEIPDVVTDEFDDIEETKAKVKALVAKRNEIYARKMAAIAAEQEESIVPNNGTLKEGNREKSEVVSQDNSKENNDIV